MLYKEISKQNGAVAIWDENKIKNCFNNGKGTKKHFLNYANNNKQYAYFLDCSTGKFI